MIRFLSRRDIENDKWNECIKSSHSSQIFGCSFYLDICCPDWSALVLNDYEAVFPIIIKNKYLINHITQPYFVRHFGVYTTNASPDLKPWIQQLTKLASYFNFNVFNISDDFSNEFESKEKIYQSLNLDYSYETIKKKYTPADKALIVAVLSPPDP